MRIFFDHNVPRKLRKSLVGHEVSTAAEMGWAAVENGELLRNAESAGFEVFLTCDQNISYQQNLGGRQIALVVITTNYWPRLKNHTARVALELDRVAAGGFRVIDLDELPSNS